MTRLVLAKLCSFELNGIGGDKIKVHLHFLFPWLVCGCVFELVFNHPKIFDGKEVILISCPRNLDHSTGGFGAVPMTQTLEPTNSTPSS